REHQLHFAVFRICRHRLPRNLRRLVEHSRIVVSVHLELVAARRLVAAHVNQLLVRRNRLLHLILLVIDRTQSLQPASKFSGSFLRALWIVVSASSYLPCRCSMSAIFTSGAASSVSACASS